MIHYRDMTFCTQTGCKRFGVDCRWSYTEQVQQRAVKWWGNDNAPVALSAFTQCFVPASDSNAPSPLSPDQQPV